MVVCVAYFTLEQEKVGGWRLFVVVCNVPCWFSVLVGYYYVPESPRWLCAQGRCEEALVILRKAAKTNGLDSDLLFPVGLNLENEEEDESSFCELFSSRWRWTTLKLWGVWGFFAFGYYGTILVITEIFNSEREHSTGLGGGNQTYGFDYAAIFVSSSAELVGTSFAIFSIDTAGRIPVQKGAYAMAGVTVCALCLSAANDARRSVLIALSFAARIFEMIGSCVSWVSTAEILTTEVRTTGHSAANAVARIGSLFSPFLMQGHGSLLKKGLVMLAIHTGAVLCVSQLPETKGSHLGRAHQPHTLYDEVDNLALVESDEDALHEDNDEIVSARLITE